MIPEIKVAATEADALDVFRAYQEMHAGGTVDGALHPVKTLANVLGFVRDPGSIVFMAMDGDKVAGVLSLVENGYWYSEDRHLADKGLFVRPAYENAGVAEALLDAALATGEELGLPVYITIFNRKRKRAGRSKWERVGATLGFTNRGATLAHYPTGEN